MPSIELYHNDKAFTFTNKVSGFYMGRTYAENSSEHYGWTVNENYYLRDYQLLLNGRVLERDSVQRVSYYPHQSNPQIRIMNCHLNHYFLIHH
jgi:hypothetical protein